MNIHRALRNKLKQPWSRAIHIPLVGTLTRRRPADQLSSYIPVSYWGRRYKPCGPLPTVQSLTFHGDAEID